MKKTITVTYEEEKLTALKMYMQQKGVSLEDELEKSVEGLYNKTVPSGVKEYIDLKLGTATSTEKKRGGTLSAVGASTREEGKNG